MHSRVLSCIALPCLVLSSCLVLSCRALPCLVLSYKHTGRNDIEYIQITPLVERELSVEKYVVAYPHRPQI
jgi:hypothetical protein